MVGRADQSDAAALPVRRSGRVLLVDRDERLLLFQSDDLLLNRRRRVWFTPGGGLEPGEDFARGAARELREETGLTVRPETLGEPVLLRRLRLPFEGVEHCSEEAFFYLRVERWEVDDAGFTELERAVLSGHRWWPLDELAQTGELVFPEPDRLLPLLSRLLRGAALDLPELWDEFV